MPHRSEQFLDYFFQPFIPIAFAQRSRDRFRVECDQDGDFGVPALPEGQCLLRYKLCVDVSRTFTTGQIHDDRMDGIEESPETPQAKEPCYSRRLQDFLLGAFLAEYSFDQFAFRPDQKAFDLIEDGMGDDEASYWSHHKASLDWLGLAITVPSTSHLTKRRWL
jgi:hypothetical protein